MADDFRGSVAQEDVQFGTGITQTIFVGEAYSKLMIFIEKGRFVADATAFISITDDVSRAIVTKDNFATVVNGVLLQWLTDFYAGGSSAEVHLIAFCEDLTSGTDFSPEALAAAYDLVKFDAYFKSILVKGADSDVVLPAACVKLAQLCVADKLYSSAPLYPIVTAPANLTDDPIYAALEAEGCKYFGVMHPSVNRNGAILQLGLSLFVINGSGTPVGNSFDFIKTTLIDASGVDGAALTVTEQAILKDANISYFKPVGDGSGAMVLYGAKDSKGTVVPADWIVAYCDYCNKVYTAGIMVNANVFKSAQVYQQILSSMSNTVNKFTEKGSGRLVNYNVTAPSYSDLPAAPADKFIIPNAWSATYQDNLRAVDVQGTLTV